MFICLFNVNMDSVMEFENEDGKDGSEFYGGGERMKTAWLFVCR